MSSTPEWARTNPRSVIRSTLRRAWVIVIAAVVGAAAGFLSVWNAPSVYEAEALIVASATTVPVANFSSVALAVFRTDTVLQPVITQLHLTETTHQLLARKMLEAVPVPNAQAVRIVGRASTRTLAEELANAGATSFVTGASGKGLGTFALFSTAIPGVKQETSRWPTMVIGAFAGGAVAFILLLLISFIRQPVFEENDARAELNSDAVYAARVKLRNRLRIRGRPHRRVDVEPRGLVPAVWRSILANGQVASRPTCCVVLVERRRAGDRRTRALKDQLVAFGIEHSGGNQRGQPPMIRVVAAADPSLSDVIGPARGIVTMVSDGVSRSALRRLEQEFSLLAEPLLRILILVR
jgi:capsular polysaccharide biosynthesis protein